MARLQGVRQMRHVHQLAVVLTVAANAAQAGATNIHPVVALGAANHAGFFRLALQPPIRFGHLDRGIGGF